MSLTGFRDAAARPLGVATAVTPASLLALKRSGAPITALTAYDYPTARLADEAGIDMLLVGDSLAMAVLGHEDTLAVTMDEMLHHARAVRRATQRAGGGGRPPWTGRSVTLPPWLWAMTTIGSSGATAMAAT